MKIIIAMDSFKGSLSSLAAGNAAAEGIRKAIPQADIRIYPVADGGEGTTEALVTGLDGTYRKITVSDPLGRPIQAKYGILPDHTAVIEMSAASGLTLLTPAERNPMHTTTFGFGEMIADAIHHGCRNFLLGIGGSATNDCGIGCLQALGFSFLDTNNQHVRYGADGLAKVVTINTAQVMPELRECTFHVACDVNNPLYGAHGCSAVFARQKGADAAMIDAMEQAIRRFAGIVQKQFPDADPELPGSGAAGGLGFALRTFLHADLQPGIEVITQQIRLEDTLSLLFLFSSNFSKVLIWFLICFAIMGSILFFTKKHTKLCCAVVPAMSVLFLLLGFAVPVTLPVCNTMIPQEANCAYTFRSNGEDMALFCNELMKKTHEENSVFVEMFRPAVTIDEQNAWGLGVAIEYIENSKATYWHSGINPGFQSLYVLDPDANKYIVILTNSDRGLDYSKEMARSFLGIDGTWDIKR